LEITTLFPCHQPPLTEALHWGSVRKAEFGLLQQVYGRSRDMARKDRETAKVQSAAILLPIGNGDYSARLHLPVYGVYQFEMSSETIL
jgi:hypothetical protein